MTFTASLEIIDDVNEITEEFLKTQFESIAQNINEYNFNKLTSSYWIDFIFNY